MGSILNLLNPMTIPSPAPTPPSRTRKRGAVNETGKSEDVIVTLDAGAECFTPVESDEMRATDIGLQSNEDKVMEDIQPGITAGGVNESLNEDARRRTSSSSLADILNPIEETSNERIEASSIGKAILEEHSSQPSFILEQMQPQLPSTASSSNPQSIQVKTTEHDEEEMNVDVVGTTEELVTSKNVESSNSTIPDAPSPVSQSMQRSASTDSQATILDPAEPTPQNNQPIPSRSPTPSKKRKFTPESSPDEPLSAGLPLPIPQHLQLESHSQISVEKPQATPSRAVKKPKRPSQIKRPAHAKKKSAATNGVKKPNRKQKEQSVGFDDVHPPTRSHVGKVDLLGYSGVINSAIKSCAFSGIVLIVRQFCPKIRETVVLYLSKTRSRVLDDKL